MKRGTMRHVYVIEIYDNGWRPLDRCASSHDSAMELLRIERANHPDMQFRIRVYRTEQK
jgi:hypothetical protein